MLCCPTPQTKQKSEIRVEVVVVGSGQIEGQGYLRTDVLSRTVIPVLSLAPAGGGNKPLMPTLATVLDSGGGRACNDSGSVVFFSS